MTRAARVLVKYLAAPVLVIGLAGAGPCGAGAAASEPAAGSSAQPERTLERPAERSPDRQSERQPATQSTESARASSAADLARMAAAVEGLSYEGTLVYLVDNRLETLHIVHRVAGGEVEERLVSLSGPVRAVTRQRDEVTCLLSEDHPISVKRNTAVPDLLRTRAIDPATLAENYFIHTLGQTRVAGRDTEVVGIIPRDDYRYGYRFYLDGQTGLPLKSDLMGTDGEPIEQIMFTTVQVDSSLGDMVSGDLGVSTPRGEVAGNGVTGGRPASPKAPAGPASVSGPPSSTWRFDTLPPGFAVRMHDSWADGPDGRVEHFLVTDHLASVSVFVEADGQGGLTGATHIGAVHAVGGRVAGYQVTVVGQVPAQTVATVLAAVRRQGSAEPGDNP